MIYLPSIVCVGFYFEKKRALATGIALCGSGLGTVLFPPFAKFLLDQFEWRGAKFLQKLITMNSERK